MANSTDNRIPSTAVCGTADWNNLSQQDIIRLNTYDFMAYLGKRVINPGGIRGRDQILDRLKLAPGDRVLEIGGGSGHMACHMAKKYRCHITSIDISPRSTELARQLADREGLSHKVRFETGDINSLQFSDESFDAVICQAVLMFVDQDRALTEVRRVLKPGGMFAGLEFSWKKEPPADVRSATYAVCGCRTLRFYSINGWLNSLRQTGFIRVKGDEHPFGLLSIRGFMRDEGFANSLQIAGKVLSCKASMQRMAEIWTHFSRNIGYFSYIVFSGEKMQDI